MCHVSIIEVEPLTALTIEDILRSQGATSFELVNTAKAAVVAAVEISRA